MSDHSENSEKTTPTWDIEVGFRWKRCQGLPGRKKTAFEGPEGMKKSFQSDNGQLFDVTSEKREKMERLGHKGMQGYIKTSNFFEAMQNHG